MVELPRSRLQILSSAHITIVQSSSEKEYRSNAVAVCIEPNISFGNILQLRSRPLINQLNSDRLLCGHEMHTLPFTLKCSTVPPRSAVLIGNIESFRPAAQDATQSDFR